MSLACLYSPAAGTLERQIIDKEDISLTGIACYSLSQLKLLSMPLDLMLSLPILTDYFQMYAYVHYKGLRGDFFRPKKVTDKVDALK